MTIMNNIHNKRYFRKMRPKYDQNKPLVKMIDETDKNGPSKKIKA